MQQLQQLPPQKQPKVPEAQNLKINRGRGMNLILGTNKDLSLLMQTPVDISKLPRKKRCWENSVYKEQDVIFLTSFQ